MSRAVFLPTSGKPEWKNISNEPSTRDHQLNQLLGGTYEFIPVPGIERMVLVVNEERELRGMKQNKHIKLLEAHGPVLLMGVDKNGMHAAFTETMYEQFLTAYGTQPTPTSFPTNP